MRLLTLSLVLFFVASLLHAQDGPSPEAFVDSLMEAYGPSGPGGVVAVYRNGETIFAKGYALADVEHGTPNTPATPYHMASVSKQFTAFAIAMLAEQGLLSLDDDVRTYVPEVPDFGHTITLRHLATHTSGLRDHWALWAMSGGRMDDVIRQDNLLWLVEHQRALNFEPGTEESYSNTGYLLLAEVVARVTGQPFGAWMRINVFQPLGMNDTQIYDDHHRIVPGRAYSYFQDGFLLKKAVLSYANAGATSLFTTAEDVLHWLRNFHTHEVGGLDVAQRMLERGVLVSGDTLDYALGLGIGEHRGLRHLQHSGGDAGYRTFLSYYPEIDAGVVTIGNIVSFDSRGIAMAVAEAFFEADMDQPRAATDEDATGEAVAVPAARLDAYVGRYQIPGGPVFSIQREGHVLTGQLPGQPKIPLAALSDTLFRAEAPGFDVQVGFQVEADGSVPGGVIYQGAEMPFRRMTWSPDATVLANYAGRYTSPELETSYRARVDGDRLVLEHRRHGTISLTPTEEGAFSGSAWFVNTVAFDQDATGTISGMRVSTGGARNVHFPKQE